MPRSLESNTKVRFVVVAIVLALLSCAGSQTYAQRGKRKTGTQTSGTSATTATTPPVQSKSITPLRVADVGEGSNVTVTSDAPLNDYSAYRSGDRYYVVIPGAQSQRAAAGLRGRGFEDGRVTKRGNDVVLSFRLQPGTSARVSQKFNKLQVVFNTQGAVNSGAGTTEANAGATSSAASVGVTPQAGTANGLPAATGTGAGNAAANSGTPPNPAVNPLQANAPNTTVSAIPFGPNGQPNNVTPAPGDANPATSTAPAPPADQVAQAQPQSANLPPPTNGPLAGSAPGPGSSLGSVVKQNWMVAIVALLVVGLVAWVIVSRSRVNREGGSAVKPAPKKREQKVVTEIPSDPRPTVKKPLKDSAKTTPLEATGPVKSAVTTSLSGLAVPLTVPVETAADETVPEPNQAVPVERAQEEVAKLLAGSAYDEAVVGTRDTGARHIIAAELLAALTGRNRQRNSLARDAFLKHEYFDETVAQLRDSDSPAERASAARALGLVGNHAATPHLIAALDDKIPEVRRAAVESLAEVRDPAAVTSLEALRDRERDRNVPTTLIQHAIEASVVGRVQDADSTAPLADVEEESIPVKATPLHFPAEAAYEPEVISMPVVPEPEKVVLVQASPTKTAELSWEDVLLDDDDATSVGSVDSEETTVPVEPLELLESPVSPIVEPVVAESATPLASSMTPELLDVEVSEEAASPSADKNFEENDEPLEIPTAVAAQPEPMLLSDSEPILVDSPSAAPVADIELAETRKALEPAADMFGEDDFSSVPSSVLQKLASEDESERVGAVTELAGIGGEDAFREISASFDDPSPEVRNAAARALFEIDPNRADSFTRALREATPERRRFIGAALASSGLASDAIGNLMGESRERTYDAFSLLFLMSKAGEIQPLMRAVEEHPNNEVRLAVVKLLALSGQQEILPSFRRLAVRGSLPAEVRSAVMEAIYQISSQSSTTT